MKRMVAMILALALLLAQPLSASAQETPQETFFGHIQVLGAGQDEVQEFDAARRKDGTVYIRADALCAVSGAAMVEQGDELGFDLGSRYVRLYPLESAGKVYYNLDGYRASYLYGRFEMEPCFYDEARESWYLPLEQMLYLLGMEWRCAENTVMTLRPQTLIDVVAESRRMKAGNPDYADLMGDEGWSQVSSSFQYGIQAAIDEIDMTFLLDSVLTSFAIKDAMTYEEESIQAALMTLRSDLPEDADEDEYAGVNSGFEAMDEFLSAAASVADLSTVEQVGEVMRDLGNLSLTAQEMEGLANVAGVADNLGGYALRVGQILWTRDTMSEGFHDRMQRIAEISAPEEDNKIYRLLRDNAQKMYDLYGSGVRSAWLEGVTVDRVFGLVDSVLQLGGVSAGNDLAVGPLRIMALTVGAFKLAVEAMRTDLPEMDRALKEAEEAHLCAYLLRLSAVMSREYQAALRALYEEPWTQELLDEVRITAQIMECSALHASERLDRVDKGVHDGAYPQVEYLARLAETGKYDGLLLLDTGFADLHSARPGCWRDPIPPEYVYGLPVIDVEFGPDWDNVEIRPELPENSALALPRLTLSTDASDYTIDAVLRHEKYGEFRYASELASRSGRLVGVDMGDGEYTYVLAMRADGTIGGAEVLFLRPVNGQLQVVRTFDLRTRSDGIRVEGTFTSGDTLSGVLQPTGTEFEVKLIHSVPERAGRQVGENGTGYFAYEMNEAGGYDLLFYTIQRGAFNMDVVGWGYSRYTLRDGELTLAEQWFEPQSS